MTESTNCFSGIDVQKLKQNSIFLLSYRDEEDEKNAERDFEFFVFVDPEDKPKRPDFLKVLHHCLCVNEKEFANTQHKDQLKKWLNIKDDNDNLLTPLNWLKIAIERYPYRLFVVIDKDKSDCKVNDFSALDEEFWYNDDPPPSDPSKWKRSPFLYKRICWVDKKEFCKIKEPNRIMIFLKSEWIKHLQKLKNNPNILVYIDRFDQESKGHTPKTLPPALLKSPTNNGQKESVSQGIFNTPGLSHSTVIFGRHHDMYRVIKKRAEKVNTQQGAKKVVFYTGMSGVQFQLPIVVGEKWENKGVGIIETCLLNIGLVDERYVQWWESLSKEDDKEILLFNRLFPVSKPSQGFEISKNGCALTNENKIKVEDKFSTFKKVFVENADKVALDVLIIHQTIWEQLSENAKLKDILSTKDYIPFVVVTSGRGRPFNLSKGSKFLPFSEVEFFLMKPYPEKFLFLKTIMSLREKN